MLERIEMTNKDKNFHQTTEEELNNLPPMSRTQKIVLAVCGLILVVGIIYFAMM